MLEPSNAARIFIIDNQIHLVLPGPNGTSHELRFSDSRNGWDMIGQILRSRRTDSKIGEKGDPTKYQVEKKVRYDEAMVRRVGLPKIELKVSTTEILRKVGLI